MIQRIQTLYMLIALVLSILAMAMNWVSYAQDTAVEAFMDLHEAIYLQGMLIVSVLLTLLAIARFKERKRQIQMIRFAMGATAASYLVFGMVHYVHITRFEELGNLQLQYGMAPALPAVALVCLWLAMRAVKKDEELVRSVDRLR